MANAQRDNNNVSTLIGVLNSDGTTITRVKVNVASNNSLKVDDASTGSDLGPTRALRDENFVTTIMAISSVDGVTPVPLYADINGNLLIDSN